MPEPIGFGRFGMPGCWALVNLDTIVAIPASGSEGMLERAPRSGRILFRWTPGAGMAGQSMFMQLLVLAPGETPSGWVASNGLEILVGSSPN